MAPRGGFFNVDGEWDIEGKGIAPDIEVMNTPKEVAAGHDPQLEAAVKKALELVQTQGIAAQGRAAGAGEVQEAGHGGRRRIVMRLYGTTVAVRQPGCTMAPWS